MLEVLETSTRWIGRLWLAGLAEQAMCLLQQWLILWASSPLKQAVMAGHPQRRHLSLLPMAMVAQTRVQAVAGWVVASVTPDATLLSTHLGAPCSVAEVAEGAVRSVVQVAQKG